MADGTEPQKLKLTFPTNDGAFQKDLRSRVDAYFEENKLSKQATPFMHVKGVLCLTFAFGCLFTAGLAPLPMAASLVLWLAAGFGFAVVGFNVAHDATHGATSSSKRVNTLLSWSFDSIGVASSTWRIAHNLLHHTYTNVPGTDTDIEPGPALRFQPYAKRYPWQKFQAYYAWFLYTLTSILWVFQKDFVQASRPHPRTGAATPASEWAGIFIGKTCHALAFLVLPLAFGPHPWWFVVIGYCGLHAVGGFTLAIVFQLAHVVEHVHFPQAVEGKLPRGFMEHELLTTANFGNTWLCTFITGGLDHQIEHHLFPLICHVHYPALSPIVKKCAEDHGIPYLHSGSFFQALASHARMLNRLGRDEDVIGLAVDVPKDHKAAVALAA